MIPCLIPVLLFITSFISFLIGFGGNNFFGGLFLVLGVIVSIILIIVACCATGSVIDSKTKIIQAKRNIKVAQERFEAIEKTIASYADKYPIEKDLLKGFNPEVLLTVPEIKSDEFLLAQINMAVKYQDDMYKLKEKINGYKQSLDWCASFRWFTLALAKPVYEDDEGDETSES